MRTSHSGWAVAGIVLLLGSLSSLGSCREEPAAHATRGAQEPARPAPGEARSEAPHARGPEHVGTAACAACHPDEAARWRGSHHDLAMQEATPGTVRGDFGGVTARGGGRSVRFLRRGDDFFVEARDADGVRRELEVAYTFGVEPIQQLLVPFPDGRLQALDFAWDTRPESAGGGRWLHLYPGETTGPGDVLHWTGPAARWNAMCAECHSTAVSSGYDPDSDRWSAAWAEIDVGCEACHGPGAQHVRWAEEGGRASDAGLVVDLPERARWSFVAGEPIARRERGGLDRRELETCSGCHARRSLLVDAPAPEDAFLDAHRPALLEEGLYHADGQILDEVFVWGSFVQSRMHAAGVTCSDCHDPHALAVESPDATCAGCHRPEVFATAGHHHHREDGEGASCVACHMPARTYMVVDDRRDHGFRVPRPDLAGSLGVPEPCTGCHARRDAAWAAEAAERWWGTERRERPHWAEAIHAGRSRSAGAAERLAAVLADGDAPDIVRATAVSLLAGLPGRRAEAAVREAAGDTAGLVRMAAAESATRLPAPARVAALAPRLRDPLRAVRAAAGRALAGVPPAALPASARAARDAALEEWRRAQLAQGGRAGARVNLGVLHAERGEPRLADRQYAIALRLNPSFVPAWVNRADLARAAGDEGRVAEILRAGLAREPRAAELHHALGLHLVRTGRLEEALASLARASERAPERARFAYVYGVALHSAGRDGRALEVLEEASRRHAGDAEIRLALATLHRDAGRPAAALRWARSALDVVPDDARVRELVRVLESQRPADAEGG